LHPKILIPQLREARCHTTARQKGPLCLLTRCTGVMRSERERERERERARAREREGEKAVSIWHYSVQLYQHLALHCVAV
jgi:hypothetical protein